MAESATAGGPVTWHILGGVAVEVGGAPVALGPRLRYALGCLLAEPGRAWPPTSWPGTPARAPTRPPRPAGWRSGGCGWRSRRPGSAAASPPPRRATPSTSIPCSSTTSPSPAGARRPMASGGPTPPGATPTGPDGRGADGPSATWPTRPLPGRRGRPGGAAPPARRPLGRAGAAGGDARAGRRGARRRRGRGAAARAPLGRPGAGSLPLRQPGRGPADPRRRPAGAGGGRRRGAGPRAPGARAAGARPGPRARLAALAHAPDRVTWWAGPVVVGRTAEVHEVDRPARPPPHRGPRGSRRDRQDDGGRRGLPARRATRRCGCPSGPSTRPGLVPAVAAALDLPDRGAGHDDVDAVARHLHRSAALLVLDGFGDSTSTAVDPSPRSWHAAPDVRVLITSRSPLPILTGSSGRWPPCAPATRPSRARRRCWRPTSPPSHGAASPRSGSPSTSCATAAAGCPWPSGCSPVPPADPRRRARASRRPTWWATRPGRRLGRLAPRAVDLVTTLADLPVPRHGVAGGSDPDGDGARAPAQPRRRRPRRPRERSPPPVTSRGSVCSTPSSRCCGPRARIRTRRAGWPPGSPRSAWP